MEGEFRRGGLVGPIILIGLGIVFLLNNLGFLEWSIWDVLLRTWPLLLIAWGIDLLIVRRTTEGTLITLVLILVIIAGGTWLVATRGEAPGAHRIESVQYSLPMTDQVELMIAPGVGGLCISALEPGEGLIMGNLGLGRGQEVDREFKENGNVANVSLGSQSRWFWPFIGNRGKTDEVGEYEWQLALSREIPIRLSTDLGLGMMDLDLSKLMLADLSVDIGLGQVKIMLPANGEFNANISGAIGMTEVVVPNGLPVRISFDTGLALREVEGFLGEGDVYYSPAWSEGGDGVELEIHQAIGMVVVRLE
jgi:hypothetical protein